MIPNDVQWSNPFAGQRLEEEEAGREPFTSGATADLHFAVFAEGPVVSPASKYWLPILALFTGCRRKELAHLAAENVDITTLGHPVLCITEERERGKRLKNKPSRRGVPLHSKLVALGFLDYALAIHKTQGPTAWLFPELTPDKPSGLNTWTKAFHKQIRGCGVNRPRYFIHFAIT